jgi:hypothetical protein
MLGNNGGKRERKRDSLEMKCKKKDRQVKEKETIEKKERNT